MEGGGGGYGGEGTEGEWEKASKHDDLSEHCRYKSQGKGDGMVLQGRMHGGEGRVDE